MEILGFEDLITDAKFSQLLFFSQCGILVPFGNREESAHLKIPRWGRQLRFSMRIDEKICYWCGNCQNQGFEILFCVCFWGWGGVGLDLRIPKLRISRGLNSWRFYVAKREFSKSSRRTGLESFGILLPNWIQVLRFLTIQRNKYWDSSLLPNVSLANLNEHSKNGMSFYRILFLPS